MSSDYVDYQAAKQLFQAQRYDTPKWNAYVYLNTSSHNNLFHSNAA